MSGPEMRVADLLPGDVIDSDLDEATFVVQTEHPVWPTLRLVVWRMADGRWCHDALSADQVVGRLASDRGDGAQVDRVRKALTS